MRSGRRSVAGESEDRRESAFRIVYNNAWLSPCGWWVAGRVCGLCLDLCFNGVIATHSDTLAAKPRDLGSRLGERARPYRGPLLQRAPGDIDRGACFAQPQGDAFADAAAAARHDATRPASGFSPSIMVNDKS